MSIDPPNNLSMLIGLHRLAVSHGDCLQPELHDLIANRNSIPRGNVVLFPVWRTRQPEGRKSLVPAKRPSVVLAFPTAWAGEGRKGTA